MYRRLALLVVLWSGVFLSSSIFPSHAQEPSNTYIYYFSDALNAFIIERADGTDTRVLGDSLMTLTDETENIHVAGPGWSPSGIWFAWTASQVFNSGYGWTGYRPYVLSADGKRRLTLLDHLQDAQLAWAPDEDILFVASRHTERLNPDDPNDNSSVINTYLAVIDVTSGTVVSSFEDQTFTDYYLYHVSTIRPKMVQTHVGQHFIVLYNDFPGDDSLYGTAVIYVFDTMGNVVKKQLNAFGPVNIEDQLYYRVFPSISPAGWVAYPTETSFHVESLLSGKQYDFPPLDEPPDHYWNNRTIFWDDSGQYALLSDGNLRVLDCASGTLSLLRKNWEFGDGYYFAERPTWSPDSNRALLLDMNDEVYSFNRSDRTLTKLPIDIGGRFLDTGWYWLDGSRLVIYQRTEVGLMIYDLVSSTAQHIDINLSSIWTQPRLSPDQQFVAFVRDGAVIYDRERATELEIRPAYKSFNTLYGGEISWHGSGDWLLIFEDALVAGGANVRHLGIARADGTLRRDLGFSWTPNSVTLNWLPPQVDPATLPPPIASPLFLQPDETLHGSDWSFYVDWSPDGRWIAAGLGWAIDGDITVWEIDTGEIVHVFEDAGENERVAWPQGDEFAPELMIPEHVPVWRSGRILAQSPDGSQQVKNTDRNTTVVDTVTGDVLAVLNDDSEWPPIFTSAAYSPDGEWLAAITPYQPLQIWRADTFEPVPIPAIPGQAVAFSPDGTQLAVTASWDVQIWDVATLLGSDAQ